MDFSYQSLMKYEKAFESLGTWNGMKVFPVRKERLPDLSSGVYYLVYNDNRRPLVRRLKDVFYEYGTVDAAGTVDQYSDTKVYLDLRPPKKGKVASAARGDVGEIYKAEEVVADVKIGLNVDEVLKSAREVSIDSLLEGFKYGLA